MLDTLLAVPGGFKIRLFKLNSLTLRCSLFQVVALGYCQTTVNLHLLWLLGSITELYFGRVVQTAPDGRFRRHGRRRRVILDNLASELPSSRTLAEPESKKAEPLLILLTSNYFTKVLFCTFTHTFPVAEDYGGELLSQQLLGGALGFCRVCADEFAYANPDFVRQATESISRKQQTILLVY